MPPFTITKKANDVASTSRPPSVGEHCLVGQHRRVLCDEWCRRLSMPAECNGGSAASLSDSGRNWSLGWSGHLRVRWLLATDSRCAFSPRRTFGPLIAPAPTPLPSPIATPFSSGVEVTYVPHGALAARMMFQLSFESQQSGPCPVLIGGSYEFTTQ